MLVVYIEDGKFNTQLEQAVQEGRGKSDSMIDDLK